MPQLDVLFDGDGCWPDLMDKPFTHLGNDAKPIQVALLDGGMGSGHPSVSIRLDLPDGEVVVAETSLRLFVLAGRMFAAKYPDLFEGD